MSDLLIQSDFADWWTFVVFPLFPLACWIIVLFLLLRGKRPLPTAERREVPWGAIDVFFILGTMLFAKFLGQLVAIGLIAWKTGRPPDQVDQQLAFENANLLVGTGIFFSLLQMAFAIWYLTHVQGSRLEDLGLSPRHLKRHLAVGAVGSLMIIPLVLLVNVILHSFLKVEYSHQVMTMVRYSLLTTAISTVLIAPLVEEFHFRVVLQGFLQRLHRLDMRKKLKIMLGDGRVERLSQSSSGFIAKDDEVESAEETGRIPWWPILVSSLLFASVHTGQGAAPYALFVFALFLGFLYRQTHSMIPCMVVHLLLNLWSFVALIYALD